MYFRHALARLFIAIISFFILLIVRKYYSIKKGRKDGAEMRHIEWLKMKGRKIQVPLEDCEIVSSENVTVINNMNTEEDALVVYLSSSPQNLTTTITTANCALRYEWICPEDGRKVCFCSRPVEKSADTVSFYLDKYRETAIYYNPSEVQDFYFDISFFGRGL
jgi:hypothetical protein